MNKVYFNSNDYYGPCTHHQQNCTFLFYLLFTYLIITNESVSFLVIYSEWGLPWFCLRARPIELGQCNYVVLPSTLPPRHHCQHHHCQHHHCQHHHCQHHHCQHHQQHYFRGDCSSWPLKEFLIKTAMKKQKLAAVASKVSLSCLAV